MSPSVEYTHPALTPEAILEERNHLAFMAKAKTDLIRAEQRRALGEVINFASEQSSFWQRRLGEAKALLDQDGSVDDVIRALPVTTRKDLQDNFERMKVRVRGSVREDFMTVSTSGSTGKSVQVEKYLPEQLKYSSAITLFDVNLHKLRGNWDTMGLTSREEEKEKTPASRPHSLIGWRGQKSTRSASLRTLGELLDELERGKYGGIFGNANQVRLMAQEQLRNPRKLKIKLVESWVDAVDDEFRVLVKKAFGCRVIDRYSSEELGAIALQCPKHNHLHLISPYFYMEVVDEHGDPVEQGQMGRIQITSLNNRTFPLLRYQLGDLVIAGPPCSKVNWPTIEKIVGRVRDYIDGPNGEPVLPRLPGLGIMKSPLFMDRRTYLFDDKAVLLVAPSRTLTKEEIATFKQELEFAYYLEPGQGEIVVSHEGPWRDIWKRKNFERIAGPYSLERLMEFANVDAESTRP
jgi:phenylacetate-CoA ligase